MKRMMKRFAAGAFAATLALTSANITALAAGETTVTVTGDVNYVDMSTLTQVVLPTTKTLQFALDPQGLSAISGTSASAADLAASAGKIVSNGEASIINWGYYPIKASAKFYVTDNGGSEFVDTAAGIDADTSKKIHLTVTPSSAATTVTTTNDADGKIEDITTAGYAAAAEGVAITSKAAGTANGMVFALEGAEYTFKKDTVDGKDVYSAERNTSGTYGVGSFKIGGELNKNADWSAYSAKSPKTLKLNAVFSFTTITPDALTYYKTSFIEPGTYNMITSNAPGATDSDASVYYDPANGGRVQLTVGTGAAESTIKTVQFVKTTTKTKISDSTATTTSTSNVAVSKYTLNATGTELTLPSVAGVLKEVDKVDTTDTNNFDSASSTYLKIAYADATYSYEVTYELNVAFADGTSFNLPVTMIKAVGPTVTYSGADLKKVTKETASAAISGITVTLGNTGATEVADVELNASKSTVPTSSYNKANVTITNPAGGVPTIAFKASAFKYTSADVAGQIVFTVTFNNGETADLVIPVA